MSLLDQIGRLCRGDKRFAQHVEKAARRAASGECGGDEAKGILALVQDKQRGDRNELLFIDVRISPMRRAARAGGYPLCVCVWFGISSTARCWGISRGATCRHSSRRQQMGRASTAPRSRPAHPRPPSPPATPRPLPRPLPGAHALQPHPRNARRRCITARTSRDRLTVQSPPQTQRAVERGLVFDVCR